MNRRLRLAVALVVGFWTISGASAHAQWGFPMGMGGFGWEGWGVGTVEGDMARGLGMFAMGAGEYNKKTAEAHEIDAATVKRWNEYLYESQLNANRIRRERTTQNRDRITKTAAATQKRLRENPDARDITRGDALNVLLDEINDPRVYLKGLEGSRTKISSTLVRNIPFRYSAAAITVSIHQLANEEPPASLRTPEFAAEREALKAIDEKINAQIGEDTNPDPATIKSLLEVIYAAEEKVARVYPRNSRQRNEADRYLRALHGLAVMLKSPAIDVILAGVEKRPEATLGELLNFMRSFNLRFGVASTPPQRDAYTALHPMLRKLCDEVAPALATAARPKLSGHEPEDFFTGTTYDDLQKKAPKP